MGKESIPMTRARVTLNHQLELVSFVDDTSLCAALGVPDALGLARELVYVVATVQPALGTPRHGEVQDALSQAFAWIDTAQKALVDVHASAPPSSNLTN